MNYFREFSVATIHQSNGSSLEFFEGFKFDTRRVFFVTAKKKGELRGKHAHKKCSQLIYVLSGEFQISLKLKSGDTIYTNHLKENGKAILIYPNVWVELIALSDDSLFSCLCDRIYEEDDYVRREIDFFV